MYTPDSYNRRVQEYIEDAQEYASSITWPTRTDSERANRRIGDAERAALTLLAKGKAEHPVLRIWIRCLARDLAFAGDLPTMESIPAAEWQSLTKVANATEVAYHLKLWAEMGYGTKLNGYSVELVYPADSKGRDTDEALLCLGYALTTHRERGEDGEDSLQSMGFGVSVTTSLGAALIEYHVSVVNVNAVSRPMSEM